MLSKSIMRLPIINYSEASEILGDDMIEIIVCLEKNDELAIENIMAKHRHINYILFGIGKIKDIIFLLPQ